MFHRPASRARFFSSSITAGWWCGSPDSTQLALVDLLRRVDVLVHERRQALLELRAALAWLEVHRLSFGPGGSRCISTLRRAWAALAGSLACARRWRASNAHSERRSPGARAISGADRARRRAARAERLRRRRRHGIRRAPRARGASTTARSPPRAGAGPARPNIVFVLTDDLAWNLVRYMPHVRRDAARGRDVQQLLRHRLAVLPLARVDPHRALPARHARVRQQPSRRRLQRLSRTRRGGAKPSPSRCSARATARR